MTALFIILAFLGLALVVFAGMVVAAYLKLNKKVANGEITPDELEKLRFKRVKKTKSKGDFSYLSYPSPLNNWGLWN